MAGRIDRAARARAEDAADLRDDAARQGVSQEDVRVTGQSLPRLPGSARRRNRSSPTTGAPVFIAMSMTLQIFCAWVSESEPPNTVKSWAKTKTSRPSTSPWPVITPSPGKLLLLHAEIRRAMNDEFIELLKRTFVEKKIDPLAGGHFPGGLLFFEPFDAAAGFGQARPFLQSC